MTDHVSPDIDHITAVIAAADDGPVVMLNLNRYREWADYGPDSDVRVSGRDAYLRYGMVAHQAIGMVGGEILWATSAHEVMIGCDHDRYDEVVAVWYPNRAAFARLAEFPGYLEAHAHRDAAIEQAMILSCAADETRSLRNPFAGMV